MAAEPFDRLGHRVWLLLLLAGAALWRWLVFTGFFGSDDVVYFQVASEIAHGRWEVSNYVGALRYGMNLPVAAFLRLLGPGEVQAALWPFLCSLAEVAVVYVFALKVWGLRAAVISAFLLATVPMHVFTAGTVLADPPVALGITLSMVLFYFAEQSGRRGTFFMAGVAAGSVFWVKEVVMVFGAILVLHVLVERRLNWRWMWMVGGAALMIAANCLLLWWITGDPLHIFRVVTSQVGRYTHEFVVDTSPWRYLHYLFVDVRHTWLLGLMALAGAWQCLRSGVQSNGSGTRYAVTWAAGLLLIFSLTPISFNPLTLIAKQANYMLLFMAPLCLLAGWWLSRSRGRAGGLVLGVWAVGAMLLAILVHQDVRIFTSNSKATVEFAEQHPNAVVYAMTNANNAGVHYALLRGKSPSESRLSDLSELRQSGRDALALPPGSVVFAVVDRQTLGWSKSDRAADRVPACWVPAGVLKPAGIGWAGAVAQGLHTAMTLFDGIVPDRVMRISERLVKPLPAEIYEVPAGCV